MEGTPHAKQREITVESFAVYRTRRPDLQYFNELLVQYFFRGNLRQVVPDNSAILTDAPEQARTSYVIEHEPVPLFLVMEYVSASNKRKDYVVVDNFHKYERELKVPYYLIFDPEEQDLQVYRHGGEVYTRMEPDAAGRCLIAELDLQAGILDRWVRFWHQGVLLELPAELQASLDRLARRVGELESTLLQQQEQMRQMVETLRAAVSVRAAQLERQDVLDRLPRATDWIALQHLWLELG